MEWRYAAAATTANQARAPAIRRARDATAGARSMLVMQVGAPY
jgi:hypothetical protein